MKLLMENWRRFVNEGEEKSKEEEEFEPHMMYDPKTGDSEKAETYERHVELDKKGWGHEKPDLDEAKNEDGKEQGVDGKACWDGYKHAGSEDTDGDGEADKDKCVKNEEVGLTERGSPIESTFQTAIQDFVLEQMQSMGMNAGDPTDRDRIKKQVMSIVSTAISAIGLDEGAEVKDKYDDEVENKNEKSRKQGMAAYLKKESVEALVDSILLREETDKERMACNKPRYIKEGEPGYGKKQKVVKACKDGKEKIIRFGDANMENKSDSKDNKSNFRSRHNCDEKKDKFSAGYWSCKDW